MRSIVIKSAIVGFILALVAFLIGGLKMGLGSVAGTAIILGDTLIIGWLTRLIILGAQASSESGNRVAPSYGKLFGFGALMVAKFAIIFIVVGLSVRYFEPVGVLVGLSALLGGAVWYMITSFKSM